MKTFLNLLFLALLSLPVRSIGQQIDNLARLEMIHDNINKYLKDSKTGLYYEATERSPNENTYSWLWPLCALIQAANEMEVVKPQKRIMLPVEKAIEKYYSNVKSAPAYQDYVREERLSSRFYDDNQWIAIAYLDAYQRTKKKGYLDVSKMIYRFMMTGLDTITGGGLYWKEGDLSTKNTCSNGPGILVALRLYEITRDSAYLKSALSLYNWTNNHLRAPDAIFYDAIKVPSLRIDKSKYSYNTGTMLQANVLLYGLTQDRMYLNEAKTIARSARNFFFQNGKLPGHYWFNAVMFRGFVELYKVDNNKDWIDFYQKDAERVWSDERDQRNLIGKKEVKTLIDQAGMLEIYCRLEQLKLNENAKRVH